MSEYQRYEFMTCDRPLTKAQLEAVNELSSHIHASATHAVVEYHWGDFKYDPIQVLHDYFDGFLYWANWGCPRLAFRFPHGVLPADILGDYDYDDCVTFTQHPDYDILAMEFSDEDPPDEFTEQDLGSFIAIRDELMAGDRRALYIAWLAVQDRIGIESKEDEEDEDQENLHLNVPPVPPDFEYRTDAQEALVELLEVPREVLEAVARYSMPTQATKTEDDFAAWIELLPEERRKDYLLRLANNEPGLGHLLAKELRELSLGEKSDTPEEGERVTYGTLLAEAKIIEAEWQQEQQKTKEQARRLRLQNVHSRQEEYWRQIEQGAQRKTSAGYDDAVRLLVELREAAELYGEMPQFQQRFQTWISAYTRRPALIERLQKHKFLLS